MLERDHKCLEMEHNLKMQRIMHTEPNNRNVV